MRVHRNEKLERLSRAGLRGGETDTRCTGCPAQLHRPRYLSCPAFVATTDTSKQFLQAFTLGSSENPADAVSSPHSKANSRVARVEGELKFPFDRRNGSAGCREESYFSTTHCRYASKIDQ